MKKSWYVVLCLASVFPGISQSFNTQNITNIVGRPAAAAPARVVTVLDTDHEFDSGSNIALTSLSDNQRNNLAILAKIWGFLKYHHPAVTSGRHHWDYELFRVMPPVLASADSAAANRAIAAWIANLGPVAPCTACASLDPAGLALPAGTGWISDSSLLGAGLSQALENIYRNRAPLSSQFYLSLVAGVGNPSFDHELSYGTLKFPDSGYQLLALFRLWNMVQYFYPDRDVMPDDGSDPSDYWNQVLLDSIAPIALAHDAASYQLELMRFIARIHDTHANLWSSTAVRPPAGDCYLPVDVRFVQDSPVVLRYTSASVGPGSGLRPGDVIEQLDGADVSGLVAQWSPLYADSNQPARMRDIGYYLTRGACGPASVVVSRAGQTVSLTPSRVPLASLDFRATYTHDLPGAAFQLLSRDVAYVKLSSVAASDSAKYIQSAAGTRGLIIDIRNYPSDFVVFSLGSLLTSHPVDFARFTTADVQNPGAFHWTQPLALSPQQPHYSGKVVVLVDEVTQSQAEYTAMAFRAAGALILGSTTAGADGNVSTVPLPGALSSLLSGIGVFYPDKRPTQRIGIVPDIVVTPTVAGVRAGRDELLEEAIRQITGMRRNIRRR